MGGNVPRRSNDVISVEQMADIVGVGRQSAYAQCRLYLASGGTEGVPCHRIGRLIRIYRTELERWLGFPVDLPEPTDAAPIPTPTPPRPSAAATPDDRTRPTRRPRRVTAEQPTLPF